MDKKQALCVLASAGTPDPEKLQVWNEFKIRFSTDELKNLSDKCSSKVRDCISREIFNNPKHHSEKGVNVLEGVTTARARA